MRLCFTTQLILTCLVLKYIVSTRNGNGLGDPGPIGKPSRSRKPTQITESINLDRKSVQTTGRKLPHSLLRLISAMAPKTINHKKKRNECAITCKSVNKGPQTILLLIVLICGDIETNPGPNKSIYPCGLCEQRVNWSNKAIACDECDVWYHQTCISMTSSKYNHHLQNQSAVWICNHCNTANFCGSFTYHSFELDRSLNRYSLLEQENCSKVSTNHNQSLKSPEAVFQPKFTSSPVDKTGLEEKQRSDKTFESCPGDNTDDSLPLPKKQHNNLRILNVNAYSIRNKAAEFKAVLEYCNPDIVCMTETWLFGKKPGKQFEKDHIHDSELGFQDYKLFRNDRNKYGGGIMLMVKNNIIATEEPKFVTDCEINWMKIKLQKNHRDLLIGCFYMPQRNLRDLDELNKSLDLINKNNHRNFILCGDFNSPDVNWNNYTLRKTDEIQQKLIEISAQHNMHQMVRDETRYKNTLDLLFTSNVSLAKSVTTIPGISDHDIVAGDFNTRPQYLQYKKRSILVYKRANWESLRQDCRSISQEIQRIGLPNEGTSVNSLWELFKNKLLQSIESNIPSKTITNRNSVPWMTRELKTLMKRKNRLRKQAKKTNQWEKYIEIQKLSKRTFREAENDYINNKMQEGLSNGNTKPLWQYIKSKRQDNIGVSPILDKGILRTSNLEIANTLLNQFSSVFTTSKLDRPPVIRKLKVENPLSDIRINPNGVEKLLKGIKTEKASGPDMIPNRVLKECAIELAPGVAEIFQHSLDTGKLPDDWRSANITPVFKKGDRHKAENYRPVSLTTVICKLLEHIVYRGMMDHLERNKILTGLNHGFRGGFSTETQLAVTINDLAQAHDEDVQCDVAILDFSKAFDTVPHDRLLMKLQAYGVEGQVLKWMTNYLCHRKMRVVVSGEVSNEADVLSGVPQGTVLGPLLFLCHINDLPECVSSNVRLFADDCLLYRRILCQRDHLELQKDLTRLEEWAATWGMKFNATKCNILSVTPKNKSQHFYQLDGTILKEVPDSPYLGVNITNNLTWRNHINMVCGKANSRLGLIRRNLYQCPSETKRTAYIALVRSILEYGAIIWDPTQQNQIDCLEKIQRKAARFISGDYHSRHPGCVTKMLQKENLDPLHKRRKDIRLTFLYKIVEGHLPAIPAERYLVPVGNKRKIIAKTFDDHETANTIQKFEMKNSRCFKVPSIHKPQGVFAQSFFVRTTRDWNRLNDDTVSAGSIDEFKTLLSKN